MKCHEFQVGDRVVCVLDDNLGVVKYVQFYNKDTEDEFVLYAVEYDRYDSRWHDCGGHCRDGHGWWHNESCLKPDITSMAECLKRQLTSIWSNAS